MSTAPIPVDPMYRSIAETMLRLCRDFRTTRRIIAGLENELLLAPSAAQQGLKHVLQVLGKRLDELRPTDPERER